MKHIKIWESFKDSQIPEEGLEILSEVSDIFSRLDDDFGMNMDFHLTELEEEIKGGSDVIFSEWLGYRTYDLSGNKTDDGSLWWKLGGGVPKYIFTIEGENRYTQVNQIISISKLLESLIVLSNNHLGLELVKYQRMNSFGDNHISIWNEKFALSGTNPPFSWLGDIITTGPNKKISLDWRVGCINKNTKTQGVKLRIDLSI
jgi:hypothetical protein